MKPKKLLILHGPIEADSPDHISPVEIAARCEGLSEASGYELELLEASDEDEAANHVTSARDDLNALLLNPTWKSSPESISHKSGSALCDAIATTGIPVIEIHHGNIFTQSSSRIRPINIPGYDLGFISGMGIHGYHVAISTLAARLKN